MPGEGQSPMTLYPDHAQRTLVYNITSIHWRAPFFSLDGIALGNVAEFENAEHHATGYLIHNGDSYKVLASSIRHNGETGQLEAFGLTPIPASAILAMSELITVSEFTRVVQDHMDRVTESTNAGHDAHEDTGARSFEASEGPDVSGELSRVVAVAPASKPRRPRKPRATGKSARKSKKAAG